MKLKKSILFILLPATILALGLLIINTPLIENLTRQNQQNPLTVNEESPVIHQFSAWDENGTKYQSANIIATKALPPSPYRTLLNSRSPHKWTHMCHIHLF